MLGTWSMDSTSWSPNSLTEANPDVGNRQAEQVPMTILEETRLVASLDRFITANAFYPCCLLVHSDVRHLAETVELATGRYGWPVLSLGTLISEALRGVDQGHWPAEAQRIVRLAVQQLNPGPILCTDIDILFEPQLSLDPLRLLRETSRLAHLVVLWPGGYTGGVLHYATIDPPHAHYRTWERTELCEGCIIPL
jgi:hypothetical protein